MSAPCDLQRFLDRVHAESFRSLCQCCGRVVRLVVDDGGTPTDGTCAFCRRGHHRVEVERPRLFPQ